MPEQKWTQTNWTEAMSDACRKALVKIGLMISGDAMLRAPVDTGRLAGSITYATIGSKQRAGAPATQKDAVDQPTDQWTLYVGTNVEYAPHMEYGAPARNIKAQPYLRPALDRNRKNAQTIYAEEMQKAIRVHGK